MLWLEQTEKLNPQAFAYNNMKLHCFVTILTQLHTVVCMYALGEADNFMQHNLALIVNAVCQI